MRLSMRTAVVIYQLVCPGFFKLDFKMANAGRSLHNAGLDISTITTKEQL